MAVQANSRMPRINTNMGNGYSLPIFIYKCFN
jgi:hypothetical protein